MLEIRDRTGIKQDQKIPKGDHTGTKKTKIIHSRLTFPQEFFQKTQPEIFGCYFLIPNITARVTTCIFQDFCKKFHKKLIQTSAHRFFLLNL